MTTGTVRDSGERLEPSTPSSSLLNGIRKLDPEAWSKLVGLYGELVYRWCRQARLAPEEARDVSQEVFSTVVKSIPRYERDRSRGHTFRGWLRTVTKTRVVDHYRALESKPHPLVGDAAGEILRTIPFPEPTPEEDESVRIELLRRALLLIQQSVTEKTWTIFERVSIAEEDRQDVARDLGVEVGVVHQAIKRVMKRLRTHFGELLE